MTQYLNIGTSIMESVMLSFQTAKRFIEIK